MPRRKRITGQNERRRKVRRKDGNDDEDNMLIISDSESDEEEEDCAVKLTPRAARRLGRERKVQVQEMTEEEMLDLALRLSKQEASSASGSERVEDDTLKKAISESLQVKSDTVRCSSQASETIAKELQTRTVEKPDPDRDTVTSHVRCKLSFPSKDGKGSQSDDKVPDEQTSPLKLFEKASPLRPMPDLSQKTSSQPSPPSPTLPFVPSQEFQSSCLVKQEPESSSEDESSQSGPELLKSPVFLRNCSVRLNHVSCSNTSSFSVTNLDCSPNSPLPPKSPVFPKTDSKQCTKLTRDTFSDCACDGSFTDSATSPNSIQVSTSHENRNLSTRLSHSKKAQLSAGVPVPADDGQEAVKLQQGTEESSQATSAHTALVADGAPNPNMPSSADDKSLNEFTSHMILYLSDNDDDDDVNEQIIFPSPVFPQDRSSHKAQPKLSPMLPCCSPPAAVTSKYSFQTRLPSQADSEQPEVSIKSADTRLAPTVEKKEEHLVSYYWGVPFCPKGQSPDDYTRVILTQLEVYEKSLKEAQRQLLHKADWGLPVFPCPIERRHNRRLKRHRVPKLMEEDEEEEEQEKDSEELKEKKKDEKEESQCLEEGAENSQQETYVVVSSPETQEELERKAPLSFVQQGSTHSAKPSSRRNPVVEVLSEDILRRSLPGEHRDEVQNRSFDVENTVCPESQMTEDNTPELMVTSPVQAESDIMEVDEMMEPAAEAAERMEQERPGEEQSWGESVPSQVECPMCTRLFPLSKVEIHAAYCDGTVEDQDQQDNLLQGNTRRMGMRRTPIEDVRFEKSQQQEKCFLCSKFFSSKEYSSHVDQCIQQKTTKQGNGLLSALSRMETAHLDDSGAGPSNTANKTSCGPTDAPMRPGVSVVPEAQGYYVSTSPIKSFTPISELTDCVINFRQQYSDRTNQRLGRKRKFKR